MTDIRPQLTRLQCIQRTVAEYYQLLLPAMISDSKERKYAHPRQLSMYLCRKLVHCTLENIGSVHMRTHHAVHFAEVAVSERIDTEPAFAVTVAYLRGLCSERLASLELPLFSK